MTPRERVYAALRGERADRVPFTCYSGLLPRSTTARLLREQGLTLIDRIGVFSTSISDVEYETRQYARDGRWWVRNTVRTPVGEVTEELRTGGGYGSSLRHEFFIKRPEDYEVLMHLVTSEVYTPAYDGFMAHLERTGEDFAVIGNLGYTPLQQMLIMWMGPERFATDLIEHPTEFWALYEAQRERHREQYEFAANSPAEFFIYGDNVTAEMVGPERFTKYIAPCYNEFAEVLHAKGKRLGSHLDGKMVGLLGQVAETKLDFIEAFAPFPDGDLPLSQARAAWPDKVISINFPSAVHLQPPAEVAAFAEQMLRDMAPGDRFIVGITEDMPSPHWQQSLPAIGRVLAERGDLPLQPRPTSR